MAGIEATYRKRELPNYAVFDDRRYFDVDPDREDCVFEVNGVQVGVLICEDLWFAEPLATTVAAGAELVLSPNASPFERDKHAQRDAVLAQRVAESGVAIAYLNMVGGQDALVFDGASVVADADGTLSPAASAFTEQWLLVEFDPATRRFTPLQWEADGDESRDALAWRAIVRGTRDYCRKNGFEKAWIGLSGGIDSSVVLAIAVDALGAENVTAVRMPSRYTADCRTTWPRSSATRWASSSWRCRSKSPSRPIWIRWRRPSLAWRWTRPKRTCSHASAADC